MAASFINVNEDYLLEPKVINSSTRFMSLVFRIYLNLLLVKFHNINRKHKTGTTRKGPCNITYKMYKCLRCYSRGLLAQVLPVFYYILRAIGDWLAGWLAHQLAHSLIG